jgi:hypothetical protein
MRASIALEVKTLEVNLLMGNTMWMLHARCHLTLGYGTVADIHPDAKATWQSRYKEKAGCFGKFCVAIFKQAAPPLDVPDTEAQTSRHTSRS